MWPISGRVLVCSAWPVHVCVWSWLKSLKTSELMHAVALDCCACSPLPGSGIAIRSSAGVCLGFRFLALRAFFILVGGKKEKKRRGKKQKNTSSPMLWALCPIAETH